MPSTISKKLPLSFYIAFGIPTAVTFSLGVWQTRRYFWKKELIERRREHLLQDQVDIRAFDIKEFPDEESLEKQITKYEPFKFEGEFLNDYTQLLGPRKSPYARRNNIPLSDNGYYILTPFKTDNNGIILINRGWIHENERHKIDSPEGHVSIVAVLREAEYPSYIHPDKFISKGVWFINDPKAIFSHLGIEEARPILADMTQYDFETTLETKEPEDYVVFSTMPATHFSYMLTWYSLSAWCVFGAYVMKNRRLKELKEYARRNTTASTAQNPFSSGTKQLFMRKSMFSNKEEGSNERKARVEQFLKNMHRDEQEIKGDKTKASENHTVENNKSNKTEQV